ncbi:MAG: homoserine kinase [Terracidiphilus sp.]
MTAVSTRQGGKLHLRLPATSANLGSGFDAAAVALDFHLEIDAEPAEEFSIDATGRDAERCARLEDNLVFGVYRRLLAENGRREIPLALHMVNGIPLGMGCGSSAAGRIAGIVMAVHFGQLGWTSGQILEEACAMEGHPDNAAACWLGGFVSAAYRGRTVHVARVSPPSEWRVIIALPSRPLATSKARAALPESYSRSDVVTNIQSAGLLGLAFAQARGDLLHVAMSDRIHQPYRAPICPMLSRVLPLTGDHGILGVALSGAGPAVLVVVDSVQSLQAASTAICKTVSDLEEPELQVCRFELNGASDSLRQFAA